MVTPPSAHVSKKTKKSGPIYVGSSPSQNECLVSLVFLTGEVLVFISVVQLMESSALLVKKETCVWLQVLRQPNIQHQPL